MTTVTIGCSFISSMKELYFAHADNLPVLIHVNCIWSETHCLSKGVMLHGEGLHTGALWSPPFCSGVKREILEVKYLLTLDQSRNVCPGGCEDLGWGKESRSYFIQITLSYHEHQEVLVKSLKAQPRTAVGWSMGQKGTHENFCLCFYRIDVILNHFKSMDRH